MADNDTRPEPKDLSHHLSRLTRSRQQSKVKQFYKYFQIPGIGQLAGGLPSKYYFPYDTLEAKVARPDRFTPTPNLPVDPPEPAPIEQTFSRLSVKDQTKAKTTSGPLNQPQDAIAVPHTSTQPNPLKKIDLATALQYGTAEGYPPLYYFVRQFAQQHMHPNCPYRGGPEVILTCGNTDGMAKVLLAMTNEWSELKDWTRDREAMLCEEHAYMGAIQTARPRGLNVVPIRLDDEGLLVEGKGGMKDVLSNWDYTKGKLPHLLYTVTVGQNPTGGTLSVQRRKDILEVCNQYDILIIEDDPYWYLQFPSATAHNTTTTSHPSNLSFNPNIPMFANAEPHPAGWKSSGYSFLDSLVPSFINFDTEGRVIRLDTFSKTVAPGCRLGWVSAQPAIIERLTRITESTTQQPSGFVQSLVAELLLGPDHSGLNHPTTTASHKNKDGRGGLPTGAGWKADGWVRWLEGLRGNYERRMNKMCSILDSGREIVKSGRRGSLIEACSSSDTDEEWSVVEKTTIYSFDWPIGGMFVWLHVHFTSHPLYSHYAKQSPDGPARLSRALWLFWTSKPYLVLNAPGTMFSPTDEIREKEGWKFFRLCFAAIDEELLEDVTTRVKEGTQAFFRIKDVKVIEDLLEEDEMMVEREDGEVFGAMVGPC